MVSPQEEEVFRVLYFVGKKQHDGLDRLLSPIHIVPQKKVILLWRIPSVIEDLQEILKLSVNVAYDFDGRLEF